MKLLLIGLSLALTAGLAEDSVEQSQKEYTVQIEYIAAEFGGPVVKGAPYSAQSVTETAQVLPDGNRIQHKNTASLYRDSQGRTRREQAVGAIGLLTVQEGEPLRLISITDPVAGVGYSLDPRTQTAAKMTLGANISHTGLPGGGSWIPHEASEDVFEVAVPPPPPPAGGTTRHMVEKTVIRHSADQQGKVVKLGQQVMEGVLVEGTRETTAIPAGQIGNERPIETVYERWYSPRLQTVVMSRRSDPRTGETIYRLTNIDLSEPAASLFQLPAGYTVKEGAQGGKVMMLHKEQ